VPREAVAPPIGAEPPTDVVPPAPAQPSASGASSAERSFTVLFVLLGAAVLFLAVQNRLDRRDPKLARAARRPRQIPPLPMRVGHHRGEHVPLADRLARRPDPARRPRRRGRGRRLHRRGRGRPGTTRRVVPGRGGRLRAPATPRSRLGAVGVVMDVADRRSVPRAGRRAHRRHRQPDPPARVLPGDRGDVDRVVPHRPQARRVVRAVAVHRPRCRRRRAARQSHHRFLRRRHPHRDRPAAVRDRSGGVFVGQRTCAAPEPLGAARARRARCRARAGAHRRRPRGRARRPRARPAPVPAGHGPHPPR
jgi:hypothetical protein